MRAAKVNERQMIRRGAATQKIDQYSPNSPSDHLGYLGYSAIRLAFPRLL